MGRVWGRRRPNKHITSIYDSHSYCTTNRNRCNNNDSLWFYKVCRWLSSSSSSSFRFRVRVIFIIFGFCGELWNFLPEFRLHFTTKRPVTYLNKKQLLILSVEVMCERFELMKSGAGQMSHSRNSLSRSSGTKVFSIKLALDCVNLKYVNPRDFVYSSPATMADRILCVMNRYTTPP